LAYSAITSPFNPQLGHIKGLRDTGLSQSGQGTKDADKQVAARFNTMQINRTTFFFM
jgi:hypothetical protein